MRNADLNRGTIRAASRPYPVAIPGLIRVLGVGRIEYLMGGRKRGLFGGLGARFLDPDPVELSKGRTVFNGGLAGTERLRSRALRTVGWPNSRAAR